MSAENFRKGYVNMYENHFWVDPSHNSGLAGNTSFPTGWMHYATFQLHLNGQAKSENVPLKSCGYHSNRIFTILQCTSNFLYTAHKWTQVGFHFLTSQDLVNLHGFCYKRRLQTQLKIGKYKLNLGQFHMLTFRFCKKKKCFMMYIIQLN
jgi:hypothetical protein